MPQEIEAFLAAYRPKFICLPCLRKVTLRADDDVRMAIDRLLSQRRAERRIAECLNCNAVGFVVRHT
jgi:hypothetical protein